MRVEAKKAYVCDGDPDRDICKGENRDQFGRTRIFDLYVCKVKLKMMDFF